MKRFIFWFVAAMIAISVLRQHRRHDGPSHEPAHQRTVVVHRYNIPGTNRPAYYLNGDRTTTTFDLNRLRDRYGDRIVFAFDDDQFDDEDFSDTPRVHAEGLPVPIVPGSRVTVAKLEPPQPPKAPVAPKAPQARKKARKPEPPRPPQPPVTSAPTETIFLTGRLSGNEDRAQKDALMQLGKKLSEKLSPEIPSSWEIPSNLLNAMILESKVASHDRDYGPVYDATLKVDVSPARRNAIVATYHHEQALKRLAVMGGGLVFILTCLGAVSGYIRSDEATKGYYTNALRLAAATGVAGAGAVIYQTLA